MNVAALLDKIKKYNPSAFLARSGAIYCTPKLLPPDLVAAMRANNERLAQTGGSRTATHRAPVARPTARPKSPQRIAREALWQACLDRNGPSLDTADEIAAELGVEAATRLIKEHGSDAGLCALTERAWQRWGKPPEPAA